MIADAGSALNLLATAKYEIGSDRIVIGKDNIVDTFFILSSGLAGEVLQKFVNYHGKIAIYGDFPGYKRKALKDFMYESDRGKDILFLYTKNKPLNARQAIAKTVIAE